MNKKLCKIRRIELRKTQLDIANELSLTKQYISLIENDKLKYSVSKTTDMYCSILFSNENIDLENKLISIFSNHLGGDKYVDFTVTMSQKNEISYDDYLAYLVITFVISVRNNGKLFFKIEEVYDLLSDDLKMIVEYTKMARAIARKSYDEALEIFNKNINQCSAKYRCYFNYLYTAYLVNSNYVHSALDSISANKELIRGVNSSVYSLFICFEAICYGLLFNFKKSQEVYISLLEYLKANQIGHMIILTSYNLSMSYIKTRNYKEALDIINTLNAEAENNDKYHMIKSIACFNVNKFDEAVFHYNKISANDEYYYIKKYIKFKYVNYDMIKLIEWLDKLKTYSYKQVDFYGYSFALNELISENFGKKRLNYLEECMTYLQNLK